MATITTDTFLDGGTARTAGEFWAVNSGTLTVRTDTRWHANAPANMTGSLGQINLQGNKTSFFIDGTKVRWMAYDTGSGNVPAIGTTITQGGISGYLLGVWASLTSAPSAVGSAMPATGFLKFREVTNGQFIANSALTGIAANPLATNGSGAGADAPGWIEVVKDQSTSMSHALYTRGFISRGDWFYLNETTGTAGQVIQLPTNNGGAGTLACAVQIETSPGSGIYEWYGSIPSASFTTALVTTDLRAKVVNNIGAGQLLIGHTSTATLAGFVPPAGCKIRTPNIFLRQCTTAARNVNVYSTNANTRPNIATSGNYGVTLDLQNISADWNFISYNASSLSIKNSALEHTLSTTTLDIGDITYSCFVNLSSPTTLALFGIITGLNLSNCLSVNSAQALQIFNSKNITLNDYKILNYFANGTQALINLNNITGFNSERCIFVGGGYFLSSIFDATIKTFDFTSSLAGSTTSSIGASSQILTSSACGNIIFDGLTFGFNSQLLNVNPYSTLVSIGTNLGPIKIRNFGTRSNPLYCGASTTNAPGYIFSATSSVSTNVIFQRIYLNFLRTGLVQIPGKLNNKTIFESVGYGYSSTFSFPAMYSTVCKGMQSKFNAVGNTFGTPSYDGFQSLTDGYVHFMFFQPTEENTSTYVVPVNLSNPTAYFTSNGVALLTINDYIISEQLYFSKGHTGFQNIAATLQGSGKTYYSYEYQIDTGSGWNGIWKTVNGTNLSAETIDPAFGFKLKMKATCIANNTGSNYLMSVKILTTCTNASQDFAVYALDTVTQSFTGLIPGSEVRCYAGTDPSTAVEIGGVESSGSTFSFTHSNAGEAGTIAILAMGYQPIYLPYTFTSTDNSILIQPVIDRNYVNPD